MSGRTTSIASPFVACLAYALRVTVPPKRALLLLLPVLASVLFGLLALAVDDPTAEGAFNTVSQPIFALVLPFACLVVGDAVLGAEVRSGAFALTWLSPTPFATIVLARWLAGWAIAAATLGPAVAAAALVAGAPSAVGPIVVATVAAAGAYLALFVLIGATVRRAALWSLAVVLLGERLLGAALAGVAQLSPQWLAQTAYAGLGPDARTFERDGVPSGVGALVRLAIVAAICLVLAVRRVRSIRMAGGAD